MWFAIQTPVQNSVSSYEMIKDITKVLYMTFGLYSSFKYVLLLIYSVKAKYKEIQKQCGCYNQCCTKIHYTKGRMVWTPS